MNAPLFVLLAVLVSGMLIGRQASAAYSPPGFALDTWFIEENGVWYQFHLNGPHPSDFDKPWPPLNQPERGGLNCFEQGLFLSKSTDLVHWEDVGVVLTIGTPDQWDGGKFASGNLCKFKDTSYLFYPGLRVSPLPDSCSTPIGVAFSKDLIHWEKYSDNPVLVPDGVHYDNTPCANWRDCYFHWDAASEFHVMLQRREVIWVVIPASLPLHACPCEGRGQGAGIQVLLLLIDTCFRRYDVSVYGHRSRTSRNDHLETSGSRRGQRIVLHRHENYSCGRSAVDGVNTCSCLRAMTTQELGRIKKRVLGRQQSRIRRTCRRIVAGHAHP